MVSQNHSGAAMRGTHSRKKLEPPLARRRLQRQLPFLCHRGHIDFRDFERQALLRRKPPNKGRVLTGLPPPQPVVEVAHHKIPKTGFDKQLEERHRIATTGNTDEVFSSSRVPLFKFGKHGNAVA